MNNPFTEADRLSAEKLELIDLLLKKKGIAVPGAQIIPRRMGSDPCPLSFAQERLWFLDQFSPGNSAYNISSAVRLTGNLDLIALEKSFNEIIRRHEALRTRFEIVEGRPVQVIMAASPLKLEVNDLRSLPEQERQQEVMREARQEAGTGFDLSRGPMLRVRMVRVGEQEYVLVVVMHHIVSDGWSMGVMIREVAGLYEAYREGRESPLAELEIQYADYAVWQREWLRGEEIERQVEYWKHQMEGAPPLLELPIDRPRPEVQSYRGSHEKLRLTGEMSERLRELSRREGVTLFMTLLAAFQVLLSRYSGQRDIVVGSPIAGRNRVETEGLIGFFVNTVVMRTEVEGGERFREVMRRVKEVAVGAYGHQEMPFEMLVEQIQPERSLSHSPLFQVMFALQERIAKAVELPGLKLSLLESESGTAKFALGLLIVESEYELQASLEYNTDLFDDTTIRRMLECFNTLLGGLISNPDQQVCALPLLSPAQRQQVIKQGGDAAVEYPRHRCIHQLFEDQAKRTPERIAVVFEHQCLTYSELNQRANQLGRYLQRLGVGPESLVAICFERSLDLVAGMVAVLKAGAAYLLLEPTHPKERLGFMLEDSRAQVLLTQEQYLQTVSSHEAHTVCLDRDWKAIADESDENCASGVEPENPAYVIYTSGSTGAPKGVVIPHRAICNHMAWMNLAFPLSERDRVLQKTPITFDASVWEFYAPLLSGAQLVLARQGGHQDTAYLIDVIMEQQITTLQVVPTLLGLLLNEDRFAKCESLKRVFCGGEALAAELRDRFVSRLDAELCNLYGPTEVCIDSIFWACERGTERRVIPIGRPVSNTQVYILDSLLNLVPLGARGELYISGEGLARGYLNRPELTAEKFLPNPFDTISNARLYKTGDLARYSTDGNIEYLGRNDHQVKIRGFRIELGEIEAALVEHPGLSEAVVIASRHQPHDERLIAYVVSKQDPAPTVSELRAYLLNKLPEYMRPAAYVMLEKMPLTASGKLDRRALPEAGEQRPQQEARYVAARSELEKKIAVVWEEVLGIEKVGVYDNFFDLGGHSLLMVELHSKLREVTGSNISMLEMFQYPTIDFLARYLSQEQGESTPVQSSHSRARNRKELMKQRVSADTVTEQEKSNHIAIIGMTGRFPGSNSIEEFWENLREGKESLTFLTDEQLLEAGVDASVLEQRNYVRATGLLDRVEEFDAGFFGFTPREAEITDPQQRLFLECAWEAIERAGYDAERYRGAIGVFAGAGMNGYLLNLYTNREYAGAVGGMQTAIGNEKDHLATRVSYKMNLRGPSVSVQTACSTSLVAVHLACQSLLDGECDMALAGGVTISVPQKSGYVFQDGGILSPDGHCRAYDAKAGGTVGGSGVGIVVLKRLSDALSDGDLIHALILGSAINNDGSLKAGYTAPSLQGQAEVISLAQAVSGVEPDSISYVEGHGTATALGDPIEVEALKQAFSSATKQAYCALGSVKTNIGHLDTAAGVAGLIKTVLSLKHRQIPASLHYSEPNPRIEFSGSPFYVNSELREWKKGAGARRAGVSSFGIGGTNAHVVLEEGPYRRRQETSRESHVMVMSAKTERGLEQAGQRLAKWMREGRVENIADAAYTLQVGRKAMRWRAAVVCRGVEDGQRKLEAGEGDLRGEGVLRGEVEAGAPGVVFMYPGQGSQYEGMGEGLYRAERRFREVVDYCSERLKRWMGVDLREVLYGSGRGSGEINKTYVTQPALFVIEYAMSEMLSGYGIEPEVMIGHSIGEYVAACEAGVMELEEALGLVAMRGQLMEGTEEGLMVAVSMSEGEARELIRGKGVSIGAINGERQMVISGGEEEMEEVEAELEKRGERWKRLGVSRGFHSAKMEKIEGEMRRYVREIKLRRPKKEYVSNVTGRRIRGEEVVEEEYWVRQMRGEVRYWEGIERLRREGKRVMVEVGPGEVLSGIWEGRGSEERAVRMMRGRKGSEGERREEEEVMRGIGEMWVRGVEVEWGRMYEGEERMREELPTYGFERERYWIERRAEGEGRGRRKRGGEEVRKEADIADWFYVPIWKQSILTTPFKSQSHIKNSDDETKLVIITEEKGIGREIAERYEQEGREVIRVIRGSHFSRDSESQYRINPQEAEDYSALLGEIADSPRLKILHCLSLSEEGAKDEPESRQGAERGEESFYSLIYLAQALGKQMVERGIGEASSERSIEIVVMSNNVQEVTGEEEIIAEKAMVLGPCKVIGQEYPGVRCRSVDVEIKGRGEGEGERIIEEMMREVEVGGEVGGEEAVAYRGRHRWVQRYERVRIEGVEGERRLREGGVYVITGGLGGVGLEIAEYLSREVKGKVVLVSRRGVEERGVEERVKEIEEQGGEVVVERGDVVSEEEMRGIVKRVKERYGRIDGVIHAAGVAGEKLIRAIQEANQTECQLHFQPKVQGLLVLEKVLQDEQLDFCILLSSLSSILGGLGLAPYSAANIFMDAFVRKHNRTSHVAWTSVNWDGWNLKREIKRNSGAVATGAEFAILPEEGVKAFHRLLSLCTPQIVVSTGDLQARIEQWIKQKPLKITQVSNEKVSALLHPRPDLQSDYVAPRNDIEQTIVNILQDLLGIQQIGIYDDFFDLGGHSLLATQVVSRVRDAFQVDLSLRSLFEQVTAAGMAASIQSQMLAGTGLQAPPIERVSRDCELPLSFAQQRLWFLNQLHPDSVAYNMPAALRLAGRLNVAALELSLTEITRRHEVLRTTFATVNGRPVQLIGENIPFTLSVVDLSELPEADRETETLRLAADEAQRPFDLACGPLLRITLLRLGSESHIALLTMHHIVSDGWSPGILIRELTALYETFSRGKPSELPELAIQYADFAYHQREWLRGEVLEDQLSYWKQQLADAPQTLELPTDRPRPSVQTFRGAHELVSISPTIAYELNALSRQHGATLFMTLLAAFQALLARYTGQKEIVVGSPISNRNSVETEALIGFFVNTLALRTDLSGNPTFHELLDRVRETALGAYAHQDLPFEMLVEALHLRRDMSRSPMFQVMFILQNAPQEVLQLTDLSITTIRSESGATRYDLTLSLSETAEGLKGSVEYNTDLFNGITIRRMLDHFERVLGAVVAAPGKRLSALSLLTATEEHRLLIDWNGGSSQYPRDKCIHELFEAQVEQRPEAVAAIFQHEKLTYRELNRRANQLGHYLRQRGVRPGAIVGICLEHSLETLVALLGILKAGGAYLPLDPVHPPARLAYMLEDSQAHLLLTQQRLADSLPYAKAQTACLDSQWDEIALYSDKDLDSDATPEDLAYVIYTSGSTGKPKGVKIEHRSLVNYIWWAREVYLQGERLNFALYSSLAFDLTVTLIYTPLVSGSSVVIYEKQEEKAPLERVLEGNEVGVLKLTPGHLRLIKERENRNIGIKRLIVGGEALETGLTREVWESFGQEVEIYNEYGPTEATVGCMIYQYEAAREGRAMVPIGRPAANLQIYVLDGEMRPVPEGMKGELYIGGEGLSSGYIDRAQMTAERFIPNPYSKEPGGRLYRTGDEARFLESGDIEYVGRIDQQVKVRGYRIELGEIEATLSMHPMISEAVVIARVNGSGDKQLVAYVVAQAETTPGVDELRQYVIEKLPEYMRPAAYVMLEKMPLTASGKLDRRALPEASEQRPQQEARYVAARSELEKKIAVVWEEVLGIEKVGVYDNFFDLGGHSLLMVELHSKLREVTGSNISMLEMFQYPTINSLTQYLNQKESKTVSHQIIHERAGKQKAAIN